MLSALSDFFGRQSRIYQGISIVLLILSFAAMFSVPVWDIDLWWHLATGRYIAENRSLLDSDPFSYTSSAGITPGRELILNGYWLSEIIFYGFFSLLNDYGIILLRVLLLAATLLLIYVSGKTGGAAHSTLVIVASLAGWISMSFTGERPQLFSFLLAPLLVWTLESFKNSEDPAGINKFRALLLPLIMLLWANLHGGFLLGLALIIIYGLMETLRYLYFRSISKKQFTVFCAICAAAIAAAFINPNGFKFIGETFTFYGSVLQQRTTEYMSPITLTIKHGMSLTPYWIYGALVIAVFGFSFKIIEKTHLIIAVFLFFMSLSSFRYVPFFIFCTAPLTAIYLSKIIRNRIRLQASLNILAVALLIAVCAVSVAGMNNRYSQISQNALKKYRFPEAAATFMQTNHLSGNIFNEFNWGGYIAWRLFPEYKIFIDGRTLRAETFRDYTHMLWEQGEAERLLDLYGINAVIIPGLNPFTGELRELVNILKNNDTWHLVYSDDTAMIFLRGPENQGVISRYSLPKAEVYTHVLVQTEYMLASGMQNPNIWFARERAYREKGLLSQAQQAREKALRFKGRL